MFSTLLTVLLLIAVAVLVFLAYVAMKPSDFRIERTAEIKAAPEAIFPLINDYRNFNRWNPFGFGDTKAVINYSGANSGDGAAYDWNSTGRAGAGNMRITTSTPPSRIAMKLEITRPFAAKNDVEFKLIPTGKATSVTWAMSGQRNFSHKVMGTLFNMDKMVGGEFAKGLATLKAMAEQPAA